VIPVPAAVESSTLHSSSTDDPRGRVAPPALSPLTLRTLALVRPTAVDTSEVHNSAAGSSR
jgi:hypothetical protein